MRLASLFALRAEGTSTSLKTHFNSSPLEGGVRGGLDVIGLSV